VGLARLELGLPDVQRALPPRSVLIDVFLVDGHYVAWVVRREGEARRKHLGSADELEPLVAAYARIGRAGTDPQDEEVRAAATQLAARVVKPLLALAGPESRTLYVCPDAALATLPWSALPDAEGVQPLGASHRVVLLTVAQDLVPLSAGATRGAGALLVGGVDYERADTTAPEPATAATSAPPPAEPARSGRPFEPLDGARREVEEVGSRQSGARILAGAEATETAVRAHAAGRRRLHFATHGFVSEKLQRGLGPTAPPLPGDPTRARHLAAGHDPMGLAGLALAGANARAGGGGDDGILTAAEASYLDLGAAELVVLSACQTSLGHAVAGEGVLGLVLGFRLAGARQVIGSLWVVDDEASRALMEAFYAALDPGDGAPGSGAAEALATAQAAVRAQPRWAHPHYWAAWVVWGRDPAP
jgi:CHAT domain-containing protein